MVYTKATGDASQFSGTCDASFMTGPSMKGVTGWSFHKQRAAVAWKATNQTAVSLFSTEAELIAVDEATRELRFLHNPLLDFDIDVDMSTRIAQDSQSTIALVESKHFNARTKQFAVDIDIDIAAIRR